MYFFVAVYLWSGVWYQSPAYPTLVDCRAATVMVNTTPVEREEPAVTSDCYYRETK